MFENAALEIGEIVSGRKKLEAFAKDVGTKTVRKHRDVERNLGGGKKSHLTHKKYVTTMKAMQFNEDFPALPMEDSQNHFILVFDLFSLQDAAEKLHYPEHSGESLRLDMFFQFPWSK